MNEENQVKEQEKFTPEMIDFLQDLFSKAEQCNKKTEEHKNVDLIIDGSSVPLRVDDLKLLALGAQLLPNIVNYLVNILPQFLYPYIVAYLQDLSTMREDPVTINELYNFFHDQ